jgi:hypothetical protein
MEYIGTQATIALASRVRVILYSLLLVSAMGCTVTHVPKPDPIDAGAIPSLKSTSGVDLINNQRDTTVRELGSAGFGTMKGDLHSWTEAALTLLKSEMEKAGVRIQKNAVKSIKVAIIEAELGVSGIDFVAAVAKCRIRMRVETGNGYVKDESYEQNALAPPSACDNAVSQAVQSVLTTDQIVVYLRK